MTFYLGTHKPQWLWEVSVPLFVSRTTLVRRKSFKRATCDWCLDSGAFTQVALRGGWDVSPEQYADEVRLFRDEIGRLQWAAPQDWMCEPNVLKRTGMSVRQHQRRTVDNFVRLREIAPDVPWIPVLQGWRPMEYSRCISLYGDEGVDLQAEPTVGVGSVCRRQRTIDGARLIRFLSAFHLHLHAFGFKSTGLRRCGRLLESSDSMAWSLEARYLPPLKGHAHKNCANCQEYALRWRRRLLDRLGIKENADA